MDVQIEIRNILKKVYLDAQVRNSNYSLRAFSKKINLHPSVVSHIMNGERKITLKTANKIFDGLSLDLKLRQRLLKNLERKGECKQEKFTSLDNDYFHMISDWYYFAILSLAETKDFVGDASWISRRLNIRKRDAVVALERLQRLKMLVLDKKGNLKTSNIQYETSNEIVNMSLRSQHAQSIDLAKRSLFEDSIDIRDITSITMAIDIKKISQAKDRIKAFRREMCSFLEEGNITEVYKLNIQLIPLTNQRREE